MEKEKIKCPKCGNMDSFIYYTATIHADISQYPTMQCKICDYKINHILESLRNEDPWDPRNKGST